MDMRYERALRLRQIRLSRPHCDLLSQREVGNLHNASLDLGDRSVATVDSQPEGATDRGGRVPPLCPELPLAVAPELPNDDLPRRSGDADPLALADAEVASD